MRKTTLDLTEKTDKFRLTYDTFTKDATKYNEKECSQSFQTCMDVVLKTRGKKDIEEEAAKEQLEISEAEMHQKRMYSFKQLFNLCTMVANNSEVNDRLTAGEENIKKIF